MTWQTCGGLVTILVNRRYAAPLYVDMKKVVRTKLLEDEGGDWVEEVDDYPKVFIGEVRAAFSTLLHIVIAVMIQVNQH